jgi:DNA-directed RNA polymerase specialized sigma24 family protein
MANTVTTSYGSLGSTSSGLLQRVRENDQDGWRRLVRLYGQLVLYWCRRANVPRDDRADVFQEVFRAVARHIGCHWALQNQPAGGASKPASWVHAW